MFEEQPQQFQQLLGELRAAANHARLGNSAASEAALASVAGIHPGGVVQLALAAMADVVGSFPPRPQSEPHQLGPFLMLVAARLLHGGLARDWDAFWSARLEQLRSVRATLETHVKHPALHTAWLAPAVNEVAVAWAVLSKMILVCGGASGGPPPSPSQHQLAGASSDFIAPEAIAFVTDEWCSMVTSVVGSPATAPVYCTILRQSVEEVSLLARSSLGRGLSLELHDSLRDAVFGQVLPVFLRVTAETILQVVSRIESLERQQQEQHDLFVNILSRLADLLASMLCFGPSVFAAEFGVDRIPTTLSFPPKRFRDCVFSKNNSSSNNEDDAKLLLPEACLALFRVGIRCGRETDLCLPAIHSLTQLCSIEMRRKQVPSFLRTADDENPNPDEYWLAFEAAQWTFELTQALLSVCGYQILSGGGGGGGDASSSPSSSSSGTSSYLPAPTPPQNFQRNEDRIQLGGTMLRGVAVACERLVSNCVQRDVLTLPRSVATFPDGVVVPFREFAVALINYAHGISVSVRASSTSTSTGEQQQHPAEEVFAEAIDSVVRAWREVVRVALDDAESVKELEGSSLYGCVVEGARAVFETFVGSRVRFALDTSSNRQQQQQQSGGGGGGGLIALAIESHGIEYALSQISLVGLLGRHDSSRSITMLTDMLGPNVQQYLAAFDSSESGGGGGGGGGGPTFAQTEAVWYLFEIAAWLATDDDFSAMDIPQPIVGAALAIEQEALAAEMHCGDDPRFWAEVERRVPLFGLMRGTFTFCESLISLSRSESSPAATSSANDDAKAVMHNVSPMIITALLSFLRRFVHTYVQPNTSSLEAFSRVFETAFDGGVSATRETLRFLSWSLCFFSADDAAMKEAGELLYAIAAKPQIGQWFINDRDLSGVPCAAAAGDDSGPVLTARLRGESRGRLAGAIVSACEDDSMVAAATAFLEYYVRGFAGPVAPQNFDAVADTVASISNLLSNTRCQKHLSAIVNAAHGYLVAVVDCVVSTAPPMQRYALLDNLLSVFLVGIEACSFSLSTDVIAWMLESSLNIVNMVGSVVRHSVQNVLPSLAPNSPQRQFEEHQQLKLLKSSASLILCAAQWGNMNFAEIFDEGASSASSSGSGSVQDRRERLVGELCVHGMLLILGHARQTDLIEVPELSRIVFRVVKEVAQTHTRFFLSVSNDDASVLLDATHWALHSADPHLIEHGFAVIEAMTVAPGAAQRMPRLLSQFLASCMEAVTSGTAVEPKVIVPLSNAVFALGLALGVDALCDAFANAVAQTPLLARDGGGGGGGGSSPNDNRYVRAFAEAMTQRVQWAVDRKRRRLFPSVLRRIVMMVRGASIFTN